MSPHFITTARLDWNDQGTPVAAAFDDVYFSNDDGLAESRYVFLSQNQLPTRWINHDRAHFVVAETGFGTGLNMLATWQAFIDYRRQHPQGNAQRLHLISVEKYPLSHADLTQALSQWRELSTLSARLLAEYPTLTNGCHRLWLDDNVCLDLWLGDVAELLPSMEAGLSGKVDAWYLDGFAPSKNPEMWTQPLFEQLARLARAGATLATFTAAGFVRRGLTQAGFNISRTKGFGRKREMLTGVRHVQNRVPYPNPWYWRRPASQGTTVILGAGIAGASLAYSLTQRGQSVILLEQAPAPAHGASGNRQAAVYPLLNGEHDVLSQFYLQAFLYHRQNLAPLLKHAAVSHDWCSVVQLAFNDNSTTKIERLATGQFPPSIAQPLTPAQVNDCTGIAANLAGIQYPLAGWVCPFELTRTLIKEAEKTGHLRCYYDTQIRELHQAEQWHLVSDEQSWVADNVVLANGHQATQFIQTRVLPISPVRGQVNYQPTHPSLSSLKTVVCYEGYLTPAWQGLHCIGASYAHQDADLEYRLGDEEGNQHKLNRAVPLLSAISPEPGSGRVGIRAATRDHLPLVGAVPNKTQQVQQYHLMPRRHKESLPLAEDHQGLYILAGLGSRGICSAPLLAEILTAQLLDEPYPMNTELLEVLNPNRYWLRKLRRGKAVN